MGEQGSCGAEACGLAVVAEETNKLLAQMSHPWLGRLLNTFFPFCSEISSYRIQRSFSAHLTHGA